MTGYSNFQNTEMLPEFFNRIPDWSAEFAVPAADAVAAQPASAGGAAGR